MISSNLFDKPWWKVVKWFIVLAAYGYMAYQLATYDDYASLWATLNSKLSTLNLMALAISLMPLNIFLEAVKWRCLTRDVEPMSLREAQSQVYCGFIGAFITPYRVGDFPTRAMYIKDRSHWGSATLMGFVGGVALTLVIIIAGLIPAVFYFDQSPAWWEVALALIVCLSVGLLTPYLIHRQKQDTRHQATGSHSTLALRAHTSPSGAHSTPLLPATGWSLLRYLVFSLQLYLLLRWVGVALSPVEGLVAIPFYYLLVTLTPNMPVADVGIRGSWAIFVFGRYGEVPLITAAVVVLYAINTLLPTLIGSVITLCRKS